MSNVFAAVLAGGMGTRMGNPDKPKQFWDLAGKPVIVHTVEKFCLVSDFAKVIVPVPETWVNQTRDVMARYLPAFTGKIDVIAGGEDRNGSIMNAIAHIEQLGALDDDTLIVTHDAVRPFVSYRIIKENIEAARSTGACDTVIPATDTIVHSVDGQVIASIPPRAEHYQGQTPQSFNALMLRELFEALPEGERAVLTDACGICVKAGRPVALVTGDVANMKLTYTADMRIARAMMEDGEADA
ncbi:MAG: 2-C-methyl-D-erythritol 4-phosphate cytidylyltransferase [Coriobacteriaceae bacterium]|jgi:2-C-methyl-D-erythritol 4-phosphate cytidylyltransferase|nr:2-C-methyl-D-erythritol 4-phosphate cytidylyltransferase [Coriobacteriaceae bacterium]